MGHNIIVKLPIGHMVDQLDMRIRINTRKRSCKEGPVDNVVDMVGVVDVVEPVDDVVQHQL